MSPLVTAMQPPEVLLLDPKRRLGSKRAVMASGQEMPSETKQIVNRTVDHEKMLGLARRFEATHVTLSLASPLMRDPGAVV